jgi:hypothetical protein
VAEWSIAAVLKTVEGKPSQGSNPCLSASLFKLDSSNDIPRLINLKIVSILKIIILTFYL